jgi:hypothetical protein
MINLNPNSVSNLNPNSLLPSVTYANYNLKNETKLIPQKKMTRSIYDKLREETQIVGWKTKTGSEKEMIITIYDILSENNPRFVKICKSNLRRQSLNILSRCSG